MRIDSVSLMACACAVLVAAADFAACMAHRREVETMPGARDESFALPAAQASYRPSPGWLRISGISMLREGPTGALHALTSSDPAATIRWWRPLP